MKIIRGALSAADVSNPNIRYDAECDCLQFSPDGGTTWNPAPDSDPRHSPTFLKPPVAGSSKQCDAAANMVKWLHDFIDQMLFDFLLVGTVTTIINSILLELEILAPYIELLAIISELAETISAIGGTALAVAFTSDQYDLLTCIFYCHADSEGRVSAAALAVIESDITAQLNTTAALVTNAILFVQGEIGLSNAGSVGSETGDCTACTCLWCYTFDATNGWDGWTVEDAGIYTGGELESAVWKSTLADDGTGTTQVLGIQIDVPANLTHIEVVWSAETTANGAGRSIATLPGNTVIEAIAGTAGAGDTTWDGTLDDTTIAIRVDSIASGCCNFITKVIMRGAGDNPFGDNNC